MLRGVEEIEGCGDWLEAAEGRGGAVGLLKVFDGGSVNQSIVRFVLLSLYHCCRQFVCVCR